LRSNPVKGVITMLNPTLKANRSMSSISFLGNNACMATKPGRKRTNIDPTIHLNITSGYVFGIMYTANKTAIEATNN